MNKQSLLPINRTQTENNLTEHQHYHDVTIDIQSVNNPQAAPGKFLPFLAWCLSVDFWSAAWADEDKRNSITQSFFIHSKKGTLSSIRRALVSAGYGDAQITEGLDAGKHDNSITYDGSFFYGGEINWAKYSIFINRPITVEQGLEIRKILSSVAPARCHLTSIHYDEAISLYNKEITYNGQFNYGVA